MFLTYIHNFRGIAMLYIVAAHAISAFNWQNIPEMGRLIKMLLGNGTVFFVFIAGYLFQYLSKQYVPKKYFFTKLTTIILPYLLVSIPAIAFFVFFQEREDVWAGFYDNPAWLQILYFYLTGLHLAPFWFIPMVSLFYLISPILIILDKNRWTYSCLPLFVLLSCYVHRADIFQSFVHFFSVYFFGMFLCRYREVVNPSLIKPMILSLLVFAFLLLTYMEFFFEENTYINFIRKLILCCIFIGFLLKFNVNSKFLGLIAQKSFGIFFIHSYVISLFKIEEKHIFGHYLEASSLVFIFFIMAVLLICIGIINVIKKIFGTNSRYLIGC